MESVFRFLKKWEILALKIWLFSHGAAEAGPKGGQGGYITFVWLVKKVKKK